MKIFNRGEKQQAQAEAKAKQEAASAAAAAPPAPAAPAAPPAPDLTAIIDANVKEMSEKIARLASTIESEHSERGDFEAKLEKMEERMRKLSSLTEMISAQYNPFVGAAPSERDPMPQPEVGLAMPPTAMPAAPVAAAAPAPESAPLQIALDEAPFAATPGPSFADPSQIPVHVTEDLAMGQAMEAADEPAHDSPARLWSIPQGFASSLLVLNWADLLLKNAPTRDALTDMLGYYQNIGWIGDPARDQILAYADGLRWEAPFGAETQDWRANVEMHERSLLYVEKLRHLANARKD